MTKQFAVYLAGLVILGLLYVPLKAATGGGIWFLLTAIGYVALLRLLGYAITKRWPNRTQDQSE